VSHHAQQIWVLRDLADNSDAMDNLPGGCWPGFRDSWSWCVEPAGHCATIWPTCCGQTMARDPETWRSINDLSPANTWWT